MLRKLAPIAVLLGTLVASGAAYADRGHGGVVVRDHRGEGRTYERRDYDRRVYRYDNSPRYRYEQRYDNRVYRAPHVYYRPRYAPPALRVEVVRPRRGYFWVNGRYDWRDNNYAWVPGYYEQVQPNRVWVPGNWQLVNDEYVWTDGYWQDQQNPVWVDGRYEWRGGVQVWIPGYWSNASGSYQYQQQYPSQY